MILKASVFSLEEKGTSVVLVGVDLNILGEQFDSVKQGPKKLHVL